MSVVGTSLHSLRRNILDAIRQERTLVGTGAHC